MTQQTNELQSTVTIGGDLSVRRIGFGAMRLTGDPRCGASTPTTMAGSHLLRHAVDSVTFIDTRPTCTDRTPTRS